MALRVGCQKQKGIVLNNAIMGIDRRRWLGGGAERLQEWRGPCREAGALR